MKIRSITYFCNPGWPLDEKVLRQAGEFLAQARAAYQAAGYEVQTLRLATIPFPKLLGDGRFPELPMLAEQLEKRMPDLGVGHLSLGPALSEAPGSFAVIPEALAAAPNIFFGGVMADRSGGISLPAVQACAEVIQKAATITRDGFTNLRFAALANVPAGAPFFPAAYHDGDRPAFAIATESADLAVSAFSGASTLESGRQTLIAEIGRHGRALAQVAAAELAGTRFGGVDFSLAPFPAEAQSLGTAFEGMGVPRVGLHGSLAAAAILTEAIDRADFPRAGFSGLMMPVLEDATLARRAAEGTLTVKDVLLYSAVCGTGLDTLPLPGDTTAGQMAPLLLDLCALALRLDKPLTARLMPVPGKQVGDATRFDFGFFANSKVMALESAPLNGALAGQETFNLARRSR